MTNIEFRIALAKLNMNYSEMARALRMSPRTTALWANGESRIPYPAELVIKQMLEAAERGVSDAVREPVR